MDGSPPGSAVPGILQARTLGLVAISFSNAWKWKVKVKSLSHVQLLATPWTAAYQTPPSMGFPRLEYWSGLLLPSPTDSSTAPQSRVKMKKGPRTMRQSHVTAIFRLELSIFLSPLKGCGVSHTSADVCFVLEKPPPDVIYVPSYVPLDPELQKSPCLPCLSLIRASPYSP